MGKVQEPDWWPECPYPADIFPMSLERYAQIVPDAEQRTALSGALGRHFWEVASSEILRRYRLELQDRRADGDNANKDSTSVYHLPEPDWSTAPGWAQWWAMDRDSRAWWYAHRPCPVEREWVDSGGEVVKCYSAWDGAPRRSAAEWHSLLAVQWQDSLRKRPAEPVN